MKTIKIIFTTLLLLLSVASVYAQGRKISGKILSPLNKPIEGAIISAVGSKDAKTGVDGTFKMELKENTTQISVWAAGYYPETRLVDDNSQVVILMMPESTYKYNESAILPMRIESSRPELTSAVNINKKDFTQGSMKIDLTQTSYSTIPSVDIELGNQCSDHNDSRLETLRDGLIEGIRRYFE